MQQRKKIFLSPPHMSDNDQKYIKKAFGLNWIAPIDNNIHRFEDELAKYNETEGVTVVSSGTIAIHLVLRLLNVDADDTVFCSPLTFVASANPLLYQGATSVLIDSEKETWNMLPQALEKTLRDTKHNGQLFKAVIIVNLYRQSAKKEVIPGRNKRWFRYVTLNCEAPVCFLECNTS